MLNIIISSRVEVHMIHNSTLLLVIVLCVVVFINTYFYRVTFKLCYSLHVLSSVGDAHTLGVSGSSQSTQSRGPWLVMQYINRVTFIFTLFLRKYIWLTESLSICTAADIITYNCTMLKDVGQNDNHIVIPWKTYYWFPNKASFHFSQINLLQLV